MSSDDSEGIGFPEGSPNETELLLEWLDFERRAVLRKVRGLTDEQARWTPGGKLLPLIGVLNHLVGVEARWIDGGFRGVEFDREKVITAPHEEFQPGPELTLADAIDAYRRRAAATDAVARAHPITEIGGGWAQGHDLRFVLVHLIDETARHAGHADATRELLDGTTGM